MVYSRKRELATQPLERKIWRLRKLYAGNGGVLPPTDPRILSMTEQQIDVELEHFLIDIEEKAKAEGRKTYVDESYDAEEEREELIDSKLYVEGIDDLPKEESDEPEYRNDDDDEWDDVEIDDIDPLP